MASDKEPLYNSRIESMYANGLLDPDQTLFPEALKRANEALAEIKWMEEPDRYTGDSKIEAMYASGLLDPKQTLFPEALKRANEALAKTK